MENANTEIYFKHQRPLESLLRTKGYLGSFELTAKNIQFHHFGTLKECLHQALSYMEGRKITRTEFSLKTHAEYIGPENYKECQFQGTFELEKGFVFTRLFIESKFPDETQQFQLRNNQEAPGKNAVIGRFRKPKPWERQIRGDFKFRRRR